MTSNKSRSLVDSLRCLCLLNEERREEILRKGFSHSKVMQISLKFQLIENFQVRKTLKRFLSFACDRRKNFIKRTISSITCATATIESI